jgi:hypothetical protein
MVAVADSPGSREKLPHVTVWALSSVQLPEPDGAVNEPETNFVPAGKKSVMLSPKEQGSSGVQVLVTLMVKVSGFPFLTGLGLTVLLMQTWKPPLVS